MKQLFLIKDPLLQLLIENFLETALEYQKMLGEKADRREVIVEGNTAIGSLLGLRKKVVSIGLAVYEVFKAMKKDIVATYPPSADSVIMVSLPPSLRKVLIIVAFAHLLHNEEDLNEIKANQELLTNRELFENFMSCVSYVAEKFQREFPPSESAAQTFGRLFPLASANTQEVIKQLLRLTVEEATTLIKAKPHLDAIMNIPNNSLIQNAESAVSQISNGAAKPEDSIEDNLLQAKWNAMNDETKRNFRKAWRIWERMRRKYRQEYSDGQTKDAKPKIKDWQTKVMKDLHWDVSESRLRDVKEMGEAGIIQ